MNPSRWFPEPERTMYLFDLPCLDDAAETEFPPTSQALEFPNGLLAWGGSLTPGRILAGYHRGIFPWYSQGEPLMWWTPSPRCVLYPADVYVSKRTRRRIRQEQFRITADTVFEQVVENCAAPRPERPTTWITREMMAAYRVLHETGVAHSVEIWAEGELVGGIYGLSIGHMFFGESMFSFQADASKVALISLCGQLEDWGFGPLDCQVSNPHLRRMGAVEINRSAFEAQLSLCTARARSNGSWTEVFSKSKDRRG